MSGRNCRRFQSSTSRTKTGQPEIPDGLPADIPILREPFTAEQLMAAVRPLLQRDGKSSAARTD